MKDSLFEFCAENLKAARAAEAGGANRVELCDRLSIGGVTPNLHLIKTTIQTLHLPVHVLIRPRGGDFIYSAHEFEQMQRQIEESKQAGAAGVVLGLLHPDGRVDVEQSRTLVELAHPMKVTFHRAFDASPNLSEALEAVVETGADCLLTSGGESNVLAGAAAVALLRKQAFGRLDVMAGGGLSLSNLVDVVQQTGVSHLHGSLSWKLDNGDDAIQRQAKDPSILESDVREAVRLFRRELEKRKTPAKSQS